jgi:hypothetical protein
MLWQQAQPAVANPTRPMAAVANAAVTVLKNRRRTSFFSLFSVSMVTSGCVVVGAVICEVQLPASMQPKASTNSNAEPGNAGLNLLRCLHYRRGEDPCEWLAGRDR